MGTDEKESNQEHVRRAVEYLDQAAHFAELAAELISPLPMQAER